MRHPSLFLQSTSFERRCRVSGESSNQLLVESSESRSRFVQKLKDSNQPTLSWIRAIVSRHHWRGEDVSRDESRSTIDG
jgi:hypothetical protein